MQRTSQFRILEHQEMSEGAESIHKHTSVSVSEKKIKEKMTLIDLIVLSKLESSKSEIRRLIKGNAIRINNQVIIDEKLIITKNLFKENLIKLSLGKKRHVKVELN